MRLHGISVWLLLETINKDVTVKKIEGWEKTIADTNAVFKKDGQIIKEAIAVIP